MNQRKKIPIDLSSFPTIISEDYLYIDKTNIMYDIITTGRCYFFARPRRFGKSLLISTLKEIFLGNKQLFEHLWIGKNTLYEWPMHPVIHIDFLKIDSSSPERLEEGITWVIEEIAQSYNFSVAQAPSLSAKFEKLVKLLRERGKIVILIDEYDYPIIKNIHDSNLAIKNREILRTFYGCMKGLDDYVRFLFLTGVSKFSKTSVFSGVNNLNDISLDAAVASLTGYTEEEINVYFAPHINALAKKRACDSRIILDEMRTWYNGYRFSKSTIKVFNPFSIAYYLHKQERANYWFESGTPTFLLDLIKKNPQSLTNTDHLVASASTLGAFDIETLPMITLLYQTGYLTIESYYPEDEMYTLAYPNEEIERSMNSYLIGMLLNFEKSSVETALFNMKRALHEKNIDTFCRILTTLFAQIPYSLYIEKEAYFHSIFQLIGSLLAFDIQSEVLTSVGRIDLVLQTSKYLYIFEFKFNKPKEEALCQIKDRRYYEKYLHTGKEIFLIGMVFNIKNKHLAIEWIAEPC